MANACRMNAVLQSLGASGVYSVEPVGENGAQNVDDPLADRRMEHSPLG